MEEPRQARYGISDIVVDEGVIPSKYAQVFDEDGNLLCEAEIYFIEEESEEYINKQK